MEYNLTKQQAVQRQYLKVIDRRKRANSFYDSLKTTPQRNYEIVFNILSYTGEGVEE